ncbi:MAG: hypothetical protein Q8M66_05930 [Actinomycetota bacterium]|nr:hypothetical protein [Actinomycetota bacterium]
MDVITIKKQIKLVDMTMSPGQMFIFNQSQSHQFRQMLINSRLEKHATITPIDKELPRFSPESKAKRVLIIRSGGIGDLLALSSLSHYLVSELGRNVTFVTQKKYFPLFYWFQSYNSLIDFKTPAGINNIRQKFNPINFINFEGKIEKSRENWFHLFYENMDVDFAQWGSPKLFLPSRFPKSSPAKNKNSVLLSLTSTANIRSLELETVWRAIEPMTTKHKIFVHETNLRENDHLFIKKMKPKRLKVIPAGGLSDYLLDLYFATNVISTDTAALHFREGVEKPAIGLFNAFASEARSKYYTHTQSFDIKSNCPIQPCFQHCNRHDDLCPNFQGNKNIAPCFDHNINQELTQQLTEIFQQHL